MFAGSFGRDLPGGFGGGAKAAMRSVEERQLLLCTPEGYTVPKGLPAGDGVAPEGLRLLQFVLSLPEHGLEVHREETVDVVPMSGLVADRDRLAKLLGSGGQSPAGKVH